VAGVKAATKQRKVWCGAGINQNRQRSGVRQRRRWRSIFSGPGGGSAGIRCGGEGKQVVGGGVCKYTRSAGQRNARGGVSPVGVAMPPTQTVHHVRVSGPRQHAPPPTSRRRSFSVMWWAGTGIGVSVRR